MLDIAVNKGLCKAKSDRLDLKKLFALTAACALTAALCFAVNLKPFNAAGDGYLKHRTLMIQGSAETFDSYIADIASNMNRLFLGDD